MLHAHGSPQIPACGGDEFAFQYPRGDDAWTEIVPADTEVLVTHGPPAGVLDLGLGCEWLMREMGRVRPRICVFGHVHGERGEFFGWLRGGMEVVRWGRGRAVLNEGLRREVEWFGGLLNWRGWRDVVGVIVYGFVEVLWDRVWGGESETTLMVNASLMLNNTGRLRNAPQVVDI